MSFGALPNGNTLFLDLDGVMADFDGGFPVKFGFDHRDVPDKVMWDAIEKDGKFFRELPPCAGALDFFESVKHLQPVILTACPPSNFEDVAEQKRAWVRTHLGADVPIVFTPGGKTKSLFMHRTGDVLIDDFERNLERWQEAGGFGIWHYGDFKTTKIKLNGVLCQQMNRPASDTSRALRADPVTTSDDTTTATASVSDAATTNQGVMPGFADLPHRSPPVYRCY
jgi:5'-nucleotidase